nr:inositol monophosphatase family protein [Jeotgalicoccus sp. WY2]
MIEVYSWIYNFGKELIVEAGKFIETRMTQEFKVDRKSNPNDLVTDVDKETQFFTLKYWNVFRSTVLSEKKDTVKINDTKGVIWIVDPIDGTLNLCIRERILQYLSVYLSTENHIAA